MNHRYHGRWRGPGLFELVSASFQFRVSPILTETRGVLATEVAGLVAADETGGLGLGGRTTGQTGVEVHNALHAGSILGSTNGLYMWVSDRSGRKGCDMSSLARTKKRLREGTGPGGV